LSEIVLGHVCFGKHQTSTVANVLFPKERHKVPHVPCVVTSKPLRDHQHVWSAGSVVKTAWLFSQKRQQALVLQRQCLAFTRAVSKLSFRSFRNETPRGVFVTRVAAVFLRLRLTVLSFVEVLHPTRVSIKAPLFVWPDVSPFLFSVTHVFHLLCLLSAQNRSTADLSLQRRFRN
tara:strand:+ start:90 stop:614 length:525 start_codon:yes stop_codon:yes gene_type:complete